MKLPENWKMARLGEVCKIASGATPKTTDAKFWNGDIVWVTPTDLGQLESSRICHSARSITEAGLKSCGAEMVPVGSVVMSSRAPIGHLAIAKVSLCTNQGCKSFVPGPQVNSVYLYFMLRTSVPAIRALGCGGTFVEISKTELAKFEIRVPPLPEQIEIARILSLWDNAIRDTTQLIAAKTRLKRALMQQLLTGKRRFQEFESSRFVQKTIGDVLAPTLRPVEWGEGEIYNLASIRRNSGGLFWREALRGDQIKVKKLHTIREGDFLISHIQAAYGAMGCVPGEFDGGHISDMYSILTPKTPDALDVRFVDYLSQMPQMRYQILQSSNGFFAERLRLNFDPREFLKQPITLPENLDEQRRICDVLDAATREIQLLQNQLAALKEQKWGLMQKLLSGEVRVEVPS